jgi:hypothetical protein
LEAGTVLSILTVNVALRTFPDVKTMLVVSRETEIIGGGFMFGVGTRIGESVTVPEKP